MAKAPLTPTDENFIKDILKEIGRNQKTTGEFARALRLNVGMFNAQCDQVFDKLQNGRVTVVEENTTEG